jgi:hypothetical protein
MTYQPIAELPQRDRDRIERSELSALSYVELLTCLQIATAAKKLQND